MREFALALCLMLTSCVSARESYPTRTATEELLISDAAEDAAAQIKLDIAHDRKCFLDTTNFEGVDAKYAISAIRQKLLESGLALMDKRDDADTIIEIRSGALSINSKSKTLIIPGIPLQALLPSLNMPTNYTEFSKKTDKGVAKFSMFAYDKASGRLLSLGSTVVGHSYRQRDQNLPLVVHQIVIKKD